MLGFTLERGLPVMHVPSGQEFESATGNVAVLVGADLVQAPEEVSEAVEVEEPEFTLDSTVVYEAPDGNRAVVTYGQLMEFVDERVSSALLADSGYDDTYPVDTLALKQWCLEQANALPVCDDRFGYAKAMYTWAMSEVTDIVEFQVRRPRKTAGR